MTSSARPIQRIQEILDYLDSEIHEGNTSAPIVHTRARLGTLCADLIAEARADLDDISTRAKEYLYLFTVHGDERGTYNGYYKSLAEAIDAHGPDSDLPTGEWTQDEPFGNCLGLWSSTLTSNGKHAIIRKVVHRRVSR